MAAPQWARLFAFKSHTQYSSGTLESFVGLLGVVVFVFVPVVVLVVVLVVFSQAVLWAQIGRPTCNNIAPVCLSLQPGRHCWQPQSPPWPPPPDLSVHDCYSGSTLGRPEVAQRPNTNIMLIGAESSWRRRRQSQTTTTTTS